MRLVKILFAVTILLSVRHAHGQIVSNAPGSWTTGTTWVGGNAPGPGDDVVIRHSVSMSNCNCAARSITIINNNGGSAILTLNGVAPGVTNLTVGAGGIAVIGNANSFNSDLVLNGTSTATINGNLNYSSSIIDGGGSRTAALRLNSSSSLTVNGNYSYTHTPGNTETRPEATVNNNSTLTVTGDLTFQYNTANAPNSNLDLLVENTATVNVGGNVNLTMTESGATGRIRVIFGSATVSGATCSMVIGGNLNLNNNDSNGTAGNRIAFEMQDESNVKVYGDINMTVLQTNITSQSSRLRVYDNSRLTVGGDPIDPLYNALGGDLNFISNTPKTPTAIDAGNRFSIGNTNVLNVLDPLDDVPSTSIFDINGNVSNPAGGMIEIDVVGNSSVYFSGVQPQQIPSTNTTTTYTNIRVDNSSNIPLTLASITTVLNGFDMINGIINSVSADRLELASNAVSNGGTSTSYVINGLTKIGTVNIMLPVGAGARWAPVQLSSFAGGNPNLTAFRVNYFLGTHPVSATDGTFDHRDGAEYWQLVPVSVGGNPLSIPTAMNATFHWKDACFSEIEDVTAVPQDLFIGGLVPATRWELIANSTIVGGSQACNNGDVTAETGSIQVTLNTALLTTYTHYTFVAVNPFLNPLPVELTSFVVKAVKSDQVLVSWETASELNNWKFVLEKSYDGINWNEVDEVDGLGTSSTGKMYNAVDQNPFAGLSYYRLAQYDFDGTITYSPIRSVTLSSERKLEFSVYPNPTKDILILGSTNSLNEVKVQVFDARGACLMNRNFSEFGGEQTLDIQSLSAGSYLVMISNNNGMLESKKIYIIK